MKFERLNVPDLPLPDLVAFNERVHAVVDPWWARKWVRRTTWGFTGLFVLFAAVWIYFASGLPSSQTLLAYQAPLPSNVRGYDGSPVQTSPASAASSCPTTSSRRWWFMRSFRPRIRASSLTLASTSPAR